MAFAHAGGMSSMLKDGAKQMSGLEEAVLKNVSLVPLSLLTRGVAQAPAPWRAARARTARRGTYFCFGRRDALKEQFGKDQTRSNAWPCLLPTAEPPPRQTKQLWEHQQREDEHRLCRLLRHLGSLSVGMSDEFHGCVRREGDNQI